MPSLKELRKRISSVRATQKITRAMRMVAASKLRRAQDNLAATKPYVLTLERVVGDIVASQPAGGSGVRLFDGTGAQNRVLLVVLSAERGLCGGFNTSIARAAKNAVERLEREGKSVTVLCGGRKAAEQLRSVAGINIIETHIAPSRGSLTDFARVIADHISRLYEEDQFDVCQVVYAEFINVLKQNVVVRTLVPWHIALEERPSSTDPSATDEAASAEARGSKSQTISALTELEPESSLLLRGALERNLVAQLTLGLHDNATSEQGARMTAMDAATRNAGEMIDSLTLSFNRTRQAIITKELIEIISGAEAV